MKALNIAALLSLSVFTTVAAANGLENDFFSTIDEVSAIATKTKLNIDSQPSVVTVLRGDQLRLLGVKNIAEALQTLPGIQVDINQMGYTITTVRGFKNPNEDFSDKLKLLIDGVAVNNTTFGTNNYYMDFPLQLIDRIEVLRGPGSLLYGDGAFYGAANIITKISSDNGKSEIFGGIGEWQSHIEGGIFKYKGSNFTLGADGYYQGGRKKVGGLTGQEVDSSETFKREYETNEALSDYSVGLSVDSENLSLKSRLKNGHSGNFYGYENRLESKNDMGHTDRFFFVEAEYKNEYKNLGSLSAKVGYSDYLFDEGARRRIQDFVQKNTINMSGKLGLATPLPILSDDEIYKIKTSENKFYTDISLRMPNIVDNNIFLVGVGGSFTKLHNNYYDDNLQDLLFTVPNICNLTQHREPGLCRPLDTNLFKAGISKSLIFGYVQDEYAVTDRFDITLGLRYDGYSDTGNLFSSKVGAVYRYSDGIIVKAMLGSAFRSPAWMEQYQQPQYALRAGKEDIKPEQTDTYELALILKDGKKQSFKINGYYSVIKNTIDLEEVDTTPYGYKNYPNRSSKGLEIEYQAQPFAGHALSLNLTYNTTSYTSPDDGSTQSMPDVSGMMAKGSYLFEPIDALTLGVLGRYMSKTMQNNTWNKDTTVRPYAVFDLTATYKLGASSEISASIKNALDREVRMPSYYYRNKNGNIREGRNYLCSFSKKF